MWTNRHVLVVCVAAAVLAGCGGSSDSGTTTSKATAANFKGPALSMLEYRARADEICRKASKKALPFPGKKSGAGYVTKASLVIPYLQQTLALNTVTLSKLRVLSPPKSQRAKAQAWINAELKRLRDLRTALNAASNGDGAGFQAAVQNDQKRDLPRYVSAARRLGLRDCAQGL